MSMVDNDGAVKDRAYEIWEREGRPSGREHEHWAQAAREIDAEQEAALAGEKEDIEASEDLENERLRKELDKDAFGSFDKD